MDQFDSDYSMVQMKSQINCNENKSFSRSTLSTWLLTASYEERWPRTLSLTGMLFHHMFFN